jgi:hypothetical protein
MNMKYLLVKEKTTIIIIDGHRQSLWISREKTKYLTTINNNGGVIAIDPQTQEATHSDE